MLHDHHGRQQPELNIARSEKAAHVIPHEITSKCIGNHPLETSAHLEPESLGGGVVNDQESPAIRMPSYPELAGLLHTVVLESLALDFRNQEEAHIHSGFVLDLLEELLEPPFVLESQCADSIGDSRVEQN